MMKRHINTHLGKLINSTVGIVEHQEEDTVIGYVGDAG